MMNYAEKYFFLLILTIPLSIILGSAVSFFNIVLLCFPFLIYIFLQKNYRFVDNKVFYLLLLIYAYLIFNCLISLDYQSSLFRNIGFIRFIILFLIINYFFSLSGFQEKILNIWSLLIIFFALDVYLEFFRGTNILGFGNDVFKTRIVSFFKDEPVAGAFLHGFVFLVIGHLINTFSNYNKKIYIAVIVLVFLLSAIIITGERSNTIKTIFGFIFFLIMIKNFETKSKLMFFLFSLACVVLLFINSNYLKTRYYGQILSNITNDKKRSEFLENNLYIKLYKSGFSVFKNYPLFGVGNKNYRIETCKNKQEKYVCMTHPHQIYLEFLSEHGLFGSVILISSLFYLLFKILIEILKSRNHIQIGCFVYILSNFLPVIPSGSFFSSFTATLFWLNFSIMYACNKNTNVFLKVIKLET